MNRAGQEKRTATPTPPEPDLTPAEIVRRAVALRPLLLERQEETEARTYPPEELHRACLEAGFYRMYVPRRYGGYEFDVPTYMRVVLELARGCASTAWCVALASAHALQIASWFEERAQAEIFGDGDFRCASVAQPIGPARRERGGWVLHGRASYASGIPYSTHYMGQALIAEPDGRAGERMLLFVAPRSQWTMLDDWGDLLGLKGSGSHSVVFDGGWVPAHWALEDTWMLDVDVSAGTPGVRVHGNPMYGGRAVGCFTMTLTPITIGAAYQALDEYERMLESKMTPQPPIRPRKYDPDFQRWFGSALAKIATCEAALMSCAEQHMEACRRAVEEGVPFSYREDLRLGCIAREAMLQAWEVVQGELFRTAGSSAAARGQRMERIFRDLAMVDGHRNALLRDWSYGELAREHLGLPRQAPQRRPASAQGQERARGA